MESSALRVALPSILGLLGLGLLGPSEAQGVNWEVEAGDLGRNDFRFALHIGGNYSDLSGSELEDVDPGAGFEIGASVRVLGNISGYGSYAANRSDVTGQLVHLLDVRFRPDGRSATVRGQVDTSRLRAGLRVDAYRTRDWRFQTYLIGAVTFSKIEVSVDSVDGNTSPAPYQTPTGRTVNPGSFDDTQYGSLGRIGLEYFLLSNVGVDFNISYEIVEFPPGTNSLASVNVGFTVRR